MSFPNWARACGAVIAASSPAFAQSPEIQDEITVTGTRIPLPLDEIGGSISVITAEDLELRQDVFLFDALQATPGLTIGQTGAFGGQTSLFIRGLNSEQTLVLIDGVRANDTSSPGGAFDAANLTAVDIERVEVLRGPQSLLYGSDAIGGVVNILTRRPEAGLRARGEIEAGSFATFRGEASVGGGVDRAAGRITLSGIRSDGISKADENDGNDEEDAYNAITAGGRGRVTLVEGEGLLTALTLNGGARYTRSEAEFDGFPPPTFALADAPLEAQNDELILDAALTATLFDGAFVNEIRGERYAIDRENLDTVTDAVTSSAEGRSTMAQYQGTVNLPFDQTVAFGAEREVQSIDTATETDDIEILSGFGLWNGRFFDRVSLNAGVRHDDHETFGGETTFRGGVSIDVPETGTRVKGSWGQGFKAPTPFQLNFEFFGVVANPDLQPEEATGWDAGLVQTLFDGRLQLEATYFNIDIDNLIQFTGFEVTYRNVAEARTRGVEAALEASPCDWLRFNANYTYLDAEDLTTGAQLIRRPEHFATGTATATPPWLPDLTVTAVLTYNGEELDGFGGSNVIDSWTRLDLRAAYRLNDDLELFGRIDNVSDADYKEAFGYGTPGVSAFGGVRVRLGA